MNLNQDSSNQMKKMDKKINDVDIRKIVNDWFNDNEYEEDERNDFITEKDIEEMTRNAQLNKLTTEKEVYDEIDSFVKGMGKLVGGRIDGIID